MGQVCLRVVELLMIVCCMILLCKGQAIKRSSFGEYCNETIKCNKTAWLKCQSSSCACLMEDMTFDLNMSKCVSKPGERCKFQISEGSSDSMGMTLYESTECVAHAHCNNGFTCSCDHGYFETVDGKCVEQKDVNVSCTSSVECKDSKFLFCLDGKCLCSPDHDHIYAQPNNDSLPMCVTKAGKTVSGGTPCIGGTAESENGICSCDNPQYNYAGIQGICYPKKNHGESCTADEECQFATKFFTCVGGKCGCDPLTSLFQTFQKPKTVVTYQETEAYPLDRSNPGTDDKGNQLYYTQANPGQKVKGTWLRDSVNEYYYTGYGYYNSIYINETIESVVVETLSQCVGLARLPCNPESNCVRDSKCVKNICTCAEDFSPTSNGTCGIGYGRTCSKSTPCSDSFKCTRSLTQCGRTSTCLKNVCNCPQVKHQIYDNSRKKCVGHVSSFCTDDSDCAANSVCKVVVDTGKKQCVCAEGFVEDSFGKCDKGWNSACDKEDSTRCDTVAELECRNGFCACPDTLTNYDATNRKCLGIVVGARCYRDEGIQMTRSANGTECSVGSHCVQLNSNKSVAGRCLCEKEFEVKDDMMCHKMATREQVFVVQEVTEIPIKPTAEPVLVTDHPVAVELPHSLKLDNSDNE